MKPLERRLSRRSAGKIVENHRTNIMSKLELHSAMELIMQPGSA
jgi:DNA-binding NarL/FixJ family response regulator